MEEKDTYPSWKQINDNHFESLNLDPKLVIMKVKVGPNKGKWYYKKYRKKENSTYYETHIEALDEATRSADII